MIQKREELSKDLGEMFLIPFAEGKYILAQVGYGGDLGVFAGIYDRDAPVESLNPPLLFRVHYGRVSPKKFHWVARGKLPYKNSLGQPQIYAYQPIGADVCKLVQFGCDEKTVPCDEAAQFEPLATWSHNHIVERFGRQSLINSE